MSAMAMGVAIIAMTVPVVISMAITAAAKTKANCDGRSVIVRAIVTVRVTIGAVISGGCLRIRYHVDA